LAAGGAAWSAGIVVDHVAVALARPHLALARAGVSGTARLAILWLTVALRWESAAALIVGWSAAIVLGTATAALALWSTHQVRFDRAVIRATAGPLARRGVRTHYGVNVLGQTPPMALPVVLAAVGRPVQAAAFGAAWQLTSIVGLVSPAVATGLFARASADRSTLARSAAATRRQTLAIVASSAAAMFVLAPRLLHAIGAEYAALGTTAVRILCVGLIADALTNIEVARLRTEERYRGAMAINATILVVSVVGAAVLASRWGASGAALAWTSGELLGAGVALLSLRLASSRSTNHADLARLRLAPAGPGERGGPTHAPPRRRPARPGPRGAGAARHGGRPPAATRPRVRPAPAVHRPGPGDDFAA
jgi:O-antigen/teichoic acid export membrane protein